MEVRDGLIIAAGVALGQMVYSRMESWRWRASKGWEKWVEERRETRERRERLEEMRAALDAPGEPPQAAQFINQRPIGGPATRDWVEAPTAMYYTYTTGIADPPGAPAPTPDTAGAAFTGDWYVEQAMPRVPRDRAFVGGQMEVEVGGGGGEPTQALPEGGVQDNRQAPEATREAMNRAIEALLGAQR